MKREPALLVGLIVAVLHLALRSLDIERVDEETLQAVASFLLVLGGALLTRAKVMPVATLQDAGLSPAAVKERAEDPAVPPHRGRR